MTANFDPPVGPPLLSTPQGDPIVYPVLGAELTLESLTLADEERLREATAYVSEWFGSRLRWSQDTTFKRIMPYDAAVLEYIPGYAQALHFPEPNPDLQQGHVLNCLFSATYGDFAIHLSAAEVETMAAPYTANFSSEMYEAKDGGPLYTCGSFSLTVPRAWPHEDFQRRVRRLVEILPVRWGAAGLTYSTWPSAHFQRARQAIYAHARRFPGFDMGQSAAFHQEWRAALRTVSWLTYLGPEFAAKLKAPGQQLTAGARSTLTPIGDAWEFQAGPQPESGDINRLLIPAAYVEVDALVRPVRASTRIDFCDPWTRYTSEEWLRRFERLYP
jgi:hypothetical protein